MALAQEECMHLGAPNLFKKNGLYFNPWTTWKDKGLADVWKWATERNKQGVSSAGWLALPYRPYPSKEELLARFPLKPVVQAEIPHDAVQAFWVGHATVLVRMAGTTFLTDPVFSKRCAPVQWAGPARVVPPAFEIECTKALPHLDFVLISHNHYDHLDSGSVDRLVKRFGATLKWYVPLGLKAWFSKKGIQNVEELGWWQEAKHTMPGRNPIGKGHVLQEPPIITASSSSRQGEQSTEEGQPGTTKASAATAEAGSQSSSQRDIVITMTPAQHWSARGAFDRQKTLWGGYLVRAVPRNGSGVPLSFWFAGDTGYCDVFKTIGKKFGPIDLSAIPIGAYEPRWFMKAQHVNPEEALQVHHDVCSRQSLAIHCCTFPLSNEAMDAPPRELVEAQKVQGADVSKFLTIQHGEFILVKDGKMVNHPNCTQ